MFFESYSLVIEEGDKSMKMRVNKRLNTVHPSIIREMKNLADSYDDVVDFTLGEPHLFHETYDDNRKDLHRRFVKRSVRVCEFFWSFLS